MKSKHTPGPWSFDTFAGKTCIVAGTERELTGIATLTELSWGEYRLKSAQHKNAMLQEQVASARIIAAAPEMLSALRDMIKAFEVVQTRRDYYPYTEAMKLIARIENR